MEGLHRRRALVAIVCASGLLLSSAVVLGLRVPGSGLLDGFPRLGQLDYSAGPPGGFAPLDGRLVSRLLGTTPSAAPAGAPGPGDPAPERSRLTGGGGGDAHELPDVPAAVTHPFTNDSFAHAYQVPTVPFTARTDAASASSEPGEPRSCSPLGGRTAWYSYTPTRDTGLLADTFGTQGPTAVAVYTGSRLGELTRGGCSSDARGNALVAFPATAGTTYHFQVDEALAGTAVFTLQQQGVTTRASVTSQGGERNGDSLMGVISPDGRSVAMASGAEIGPGEGGRPCNQIRGAVLPCGKLATYLRDRTRHVTTNLYPEQSVALADSDLGSLVVPGSASRDGRYEVFWATVKLHEPSGVTTRLSPYRFEVFRVDHLRKQVDRVSVKCDSCPGSDTDASSARAEISLDGRYVAFVSWASNITPDAPSKGRGIYVRDMVREVTSRVDVPSDAELASLGEPDNAPSERAADGMQDQGSDLFSISSDAQARYVVFKSSSTNLVHGDHNKASDVFVRDRIAGTTVRVNVSSSGAEANAATRSVLGVGLHTISSDGRYVAFNSDATNLVPDATKGIENVYRRDLWTGQTILANRSWTGDPADAGVRQDPLRLVFTYAAPLLVAGGPSVGLSELSYSMTPDGRFVVFNSDAKNLVPGDSNEVTDVFLRDLVRGSTLRISVSSEGIQSDGACGSPTMSLDARFVAFDCRASKLVHGDGNSGNDVFVREIPGPRRLSGWY